MELWETGTDSLAEKYIMDKSYGSELSYLIRFLLTDQNKWNS